MGLAQIGEFSFIIAGLGLSLKVTSDFLYPIAVTVSAITTLLTPYLIRSADGLVSRFDRVAPSPLVNYLAIYTRWVGQWREHSQPNRTKKLVRRWIWQMALNLALVAGVFISADLLAEKPPAWMPSFAGRADMIRGGLWLGAMLLSLPMLIATYRKLQALGMLVGEAAVTRLQDKPRAGAVQGIIAHTVLSAGVILIGLLLLLLSAALLPSWKVLIPLLAVAAGLTVLLWRNSIRIYSKAQVALQQVLAQPPAPHPQEPNPLAGLLKDAQIERATVGSNSSARGKLIRELALRTRTGASIVAIERNGTSIVNPGPDEELVAGDQVLLLGRGPQLQAAHRILDEPVTAKSA